MMSPIVTCRAALAAFTCLIAAVACGGEDGPTAPLPFVGTYLLRRVDGAGLPARMRESITPCSGSSPGGRTLDLVAARLVADEAGTDSLVLTTRDTCTYSNAPSTSTDATVANVIAVRGDTVCLVECVPATRTGRRVSFSTYVYGAPHTLEFERQ